MMIFVTASIASGNNDTISRTLIFITTICGEASHTIRKIGKYCEALRGGLSSGEPDWLFVAPTFLVLTWYATPSLYTLTTRRDSAALLRALHLDDEGRS